MCGIHLELKLIRGHGQDKSNSSSNSSDVRSSKRRSRKDAEVVMTLADDETQGGNEEGQPQEGGEEQRQPQGEGGGEGLWNFIKARGPDHYQCHYVNVSAGAGVGAVRTKKMQFESHSGTCSFHPTNDDGKSRDVANAIDDLSSSGTESGETPEEEGEEQPEINIEMKFEASVLGLREEFCPQPCVASTHALSSGLAQEGHRKDGKDEGNVLLYNGEVYGYWGRDLASNASSPTTTTFHEIPTSISDTRWMFNRLSEIFALGSHPRNDFYDDEDDDDDDDDDGSDDDETVQRDDVSALHGQGLSQIEVERLRESEGETNKVDKMKDMLREFLDNLSGPWSLVFFHAKSNKVLIGRDYLGRRSLVWRCIPFNEEGTENPTVNGPWEAFQCASAIPNTDQNSKIFAGDTNTTTSWKEVDVSSVYVFDLNNVQTRNRSNDNVNMSGFHMEPLFNRNPNTQLYHNLTPGFPEYQVVDQNPKLEQSGFLKLLCALDRAVQLRVKDMRKWGVGILFSGGLDCTVLAALVHRHYPTHLPIILYNVAFVPSETKSKIVENKQSGPVKHRNQGRESKPQKGRNSSYVKTANLASSTATTSTAAAATTTTVQAQPQQLLNTDRMNGIASVEELRKVFPGRVWEFKEINVSAEQLSRATDIILHLVSPLDRSVMNVNLAAALFFAANGNEVSPQQKSQEPRVLLSGIGADELMGGYSRHAKAGTNSDIKLKEELMMDFNRLWHRNLGRDDRIVGFHGKELRMPFLDEMVVAVVYSLPIQEIANPHLPRGTGDKMILRKVASHLGLPLTASRPKKAMQFGTRISKMSPGKQANAPFPGFHPESI